MSLTLYAGIALAVTGTLGASVLIFLKRYYYHDYLAHLEYADPIPCPVGFYNPTAGQGLVAACLACTPGSYCAGQALVAVSGPTDQSLSIASSWSWSRGCSLSVQVSVLVGPLPEFLK